MEIDKLKKLKEVNAKLKSEFCGIDSIIDYVTTSITPWYVSPELLERPIVISLWGMTGTGKTSLVRKLIQYLDLDKRLISVNCGKKDEDNSADGDVSGGSISGLVTNCASTEFSLSDPLSLVFVLDEFQRMRTLDETGCEEENSFSIPIWELLDTGRVYLGSKDYMTTDFCETSHRAIKFFELYPELLDIKVDKTRLGVIDFDDCMKIISKEGCPFTEDFIGYENLRCSSMKQLEENLREERGLSGKEGKDKKNKDKNGGLKLTASGNYLTGEEHNSTIFIAGGGQFTAFSIRFLKLSKNDRDKATELRDKIVDVRTCLDYIKFYLDCYQRQKYYDCSKSLVFVVGNLDEAFQVSSSIDPDIDADTYADITSNVTTEDIKKSLKKRFRPEQIARFGNTIVKYPCLRKRDFYQIIEKEVGRLVSKISVSGHNVSVDSSVHDLLYSEGVYPVQGVRPLLSTIYNILMPVLSDITGTTDPGRYTLGLNSTELKTPEIDILLKQGDNVVKVFPIKLNLGSLREVKKSKTRYIKSVHETGHAILLMSCFGIVPKIVVAVGSDSGGFCDVYDPARNNEIDSLGQTKNDTMVALGGWCAEKYIFSSFDYTSLNSISELLKNDLTGDKHDMILLGSFSDILSAWYSFVYPILEGGTIFPGFITGSSECVSNNSPVPMGLDITKGSKDEVIKWISEEYFILVKRTFRILKRERKLLVEMALCLSESGSIREKEIRDLVDKYGTPEIKKSLTETYTIEDRSKRILENLRSLYS